MAGLPPASEKEPPSEKKSSSNYILDESEDPSATPDKKPKNPSTAGPDSPPPYNAPQTDTYHLAGVQPLVPFNLTTAPWLPFHIYRDSLFNRDLTIMTPQKDSIAYTVDVVSTSAYSRPPHMLVYRGPRDIPNQQQQQQQMPQQGSPEEDEKEKGGKTKRQQQSQSQGRAQQQQQQQTPAILIGAIVFLNSRDIEIVFHNRSPPTVLAHQGLMSRAHMFTSPAPRIGNLTWERAWNGAGSTSDMVLRNWQGHTVARFHSRVSVDKRGVLDVAEGGLGEFWVDEVVISAIAVTEYSRRR